MWFGRKLKLTKHQRMEALARREAGEALTDIARTFGVSHSTISRLAGVTFMNSAAQTTRRLIKHSSVEVRVRYPGDVRSPFFPCVKRLSSDAGGRSGLFFSALWHPFSRPFNP